MEGDAREIKEEMHCNMDVAASLKMKGVPCRALNILVVLENLGDWAFGER